MTSWCESSSQTLVGPSHRQGGLSRCHREVSLQNWRRRPGLLGCPGAFILADIFSVHDLWVLSREMLRGQKSQSGHWTGKEGFQWATEVFSSFVPLHPICWHQQGERRITAEWSSWTPSVTLTPSVPDWPLGHGCSRRGETTSRARGVRLWPHRLSAAGHCRRLALDVFLAGLLPPFPHCKLKNTSGHYKQLITSFVRF